MSMPSQAHDELVAFGDFQDEPARRNCVIGNGRVTHFTKNGETTMCGKALDPDSETRTDISNGLFLLRVRCESCTSRL